MISKYASLEDILIMVDSKNTGDSTLLEIGKLSIIQKKILR
jgi:hypothetical protein